MGFACTLPGVLLENTAMTTSNQLVSTNCRLCGYLCGLIAQVEHGRVVAVQPDPNRYPYDSRVVSGCMRSRINPQFVEHPQRLNHPLKRSRKRGSGQWETCSWEQALDEIALRLDNLRQQFGSETLATSIGGARANYWPLHRFMNLFGSPNNIGIGQICWNPQVWVNTLTFGWPIEYELDPGVTGCAVLWGTNPAESDNSLFWRTIQQFTQQDGSLIVIDPRYTRTARRANIHLPLKPGTDAALALGFLHIIIEEDLYDHSFVNEWCQGFESLQQRVASYPPEKVAAITDLQVNDIVQAARLFATQRPATLISGRGVDQIGGNSIQALRAIALLRAITGGIDIQGSSHLANMPDFIPEIDLELSDLLPESQRKKQLGNEHISLQTYQGYEQVSEYTQQHGKRLPHRYLTSAHPNLVWRAMKSDEPYPIKAFIVMASNPLISHADSRLIYEAMQSLDLLVVLDYFMTPTAMLADYVLPIAGTMERPVLQTDAGISNIAYGGPSAIPPLAQRRTDFEFWRELGTRFEQGSYWPWLNLEQCFEDVLASAGLNWEEFCSTGLYAPPRKYHQHTKIDPSSQKPMGFATPSGKVELYSTILADLGYDPLPNHSPIETWLTQPDSQEDFPLTLLTGARQQPYYASEFRQFPKLRSRHPQPLVEVSPQASEKYNLETGDLVWVETPNGRARFWVKICNLRPEVISVEYGWWLPELDPAEPELGGVWISNANLLTTAKIEMCDPLLGQWPYNGLPCRIYRTSEPIELQASSEFTDRAIQGFDPVE